MKRCLKKALTAIGIIKALVSRTLFAAHGFVCIWRVVVVKENPLFWCLTCSLPLLVFEAIFTVKKKKGGEWKWICPSVFLYLGIAVPAIWFLELDLLEKRLHGLHNNKIKVHKRMHGTVLPGQIKIPIFLKEDDWCKILEQMLLLILIIGRWLLPKGEITREQLSQLLLVYIGMAADIIELFEAFKEKQVKNNRILTLIIMSLWTASLLQFTFVLTATKSKTTRPVLLQSRSSASTRSSGKRRCCPTEALSILVSVLLQDGPFLVLRMMLIFRYRVLSYTNLFFTLKNSLVITLQFYRLIILFCQKPDAAAVIIAEDFDKSVKLISDEKNGAKMLVFDKGRSSIDGKNSSLRRQESVTSTSLPSADIEMNCGKSLSSGSAKSICDIDADMIDIQKVLDNCVISLTDAHQSCSTSTHVERADGKRAFPDDVIKHGDRDIDDFDLKPRNAALETKTANCCKEERTGKGKGKSKGKKKKEKKKTAEQNWKEAKKLASAIAFINETGKYKSIVLNAPHEDGGGIDAHEKKKKKRKSSELEDTGG